jgi:iron-sulfur cluster assembly protein
MVTMTATAAERLRGIQEQEGYSGKPLRIRAVPGGCSGYQYDMVFDDEQTGDHRFESNGMALVVDADSLPLLNGSEIDFEESFGASGFKIKNPNASGGCGCGKSFQT